MDQKTLKKMNREELIQLLINEVERSGELERRLNEAENALQERKIDLSEAGSIAEASIRINRVFEAAESAAKQYLSNVREIEEEKKTEWARIDEENRKKAAALVFETEERCRRMISEAQKTAGDYWNDVREKVDQLISLHEDLRIILGRGPST